LSSPSDWTPASRRCRRTGPLGAAHPLRIGSLDRPEDLIPVFAYGGEVSVVSPTLTAISERITLDSGVSFDLLPRVADGSYPKEVPAKGDEACY
jgi:hypothetical protein